MVCVAFTVTVWAAADARGAHPPSSFVSQFHLLGRSGDQQRAIGWLGLAWLFFVGVPHDGVACSGPTTVTSTRTYKVIACGCLAVLITLHIEGGGGLVLALS